MMMLMMMCMIYKDDVGDDGKQEGRLWDMFCGTRILTTHLKAIVPYVFLPGKLISVLSHTIPWLPSGNLR